ncbi:MAG: hypothetical protein MJ240_00020 [Kiritimatiellae bacterium]|nr:hypothetical protein [Kiritimatiellia bacterium]
MKIKSMAGIALLAICCSAGVENGMFYPDWVEDPSACAVCGDAEGYLSFGQAVAMYGLVETYDPSSDCYHYTGSCSLKVGKSKKGLTKWTSGVVSAQLGKFTMSATEKITWNEGEGIYNKGFWFSSLMVEWFPLYAWHDFQTDRGVSGYASYAIYDGKQKGLATLKDKTYIVSLYSDAGSAIVNLAIGASGKVKVSGTDFSGAKLKAVNTYVVGYYKDGEDEWAQIPVYVQTGDGRGSIGFYLSLYVDGGRWYASPEEVSWYSPAFGALHVDVSVGEIGGMSGIYGFDASDIENALSEYAESLCRENDNGGTYAYVMSDFLYCNDIQFLGSKVIVPKAGAVKMQKFSEDGEVWYEPICTSEENPMGLKLSYKPKTGAMTGSFSVYIAVDTGKIKKVRIDGEMEETEVWTSSIKKVSVKVSGYAVDGYAILWATVKGSEPANVFLYQ